MTAQFKLDSDRVHIILSFAIKGDVDPVCLISVLISRPLPDHQGTTL